MAVMEILILMLVAIAGGATALTRDPTSQTIAVSFYGLLLALMFFIFQAPDVALSQIVIGAVALPLMVLLALAKIQRTTEDKEQEHSQGHGKSVHERAEGEPTV